MTHETSHRAPTTDQNLEPIAALASGRGPSAIAIIRVSGSYSHKLLAPMLQFGNNNSLSLRTMHLCRVIDPRDHSMIDEAMAVYFAHGASFTGEESAEIYCHGGPFIVQKTLEILYALGFRAANPGEFSQRAFLNGKIDLTAAEGIRELTQAVSHQQWLAAHQLTTGHLKNEILNLRKSLINAMAFLEARIDFPDEGETSKVAMEDVTTRVISVEDKVKRLAATYHSGKIAVDGLRVVLCGEPNVGKSTLLNTLLGQERAIVSDIAGTTRDYIEEPCLIKGRLIRLIDTAGVRDNAEAVEKIGIALTRKLAKEADLVIFLQSSDAVGDPNIVINHWVEEMRPRDYIKVMTKADLATPAWSDGWVVVSCKQPSDKVTHDISQLHDEICQRVDSAMHQLEEQTFITSARHLHALHQAEKALTSFHQSLKNQAYEEMLAFELLQATKALGAIIGEVGTEDILDEIFSTFCVGK